MNSVQSTFMETEISKMHLAYQTEHSRGSAASHEKMFETALKLIALMMRQSNRLDHDHVSKMAEDIRVQVKKVQDTHNTYGSLAVTTLAATISIVSGLVGIAAPIAASGLLSTSLSIGKETLTQCSAASTAGGAIGSGVGSFGKIFDEKASATRTGESHRMEEHKRNQGDLDNAIRQNEARLKEAIRESKETANAHHQASQQVMAH